MAKVGRLSALGVRISLTSVGGRAAEQVFVWLQTHFSDPNQVLPQAVNRATERTWAVLHQSLEDRQSFFLRWRSLFSSGAVKGMEVSLRQLISEQDEKFRAGCRAEWPRLEVLQATDEDWLRSVADMMPVTQGTDLLVQARAVVKQEADTLRAAGLEYLPQFMEIELPNGGGPLLLRIFNNFLRAEVQESQELAQFLSFTLLEKLSATQNHILELLEEILNRLPAEMAREPVVQPRMSAILRSADDQQVFEEFLKRVQTLPGAAHDPQINAVLGRLGMAVGQFDKAQTLFATSAAYASQHSAQAQAHYNAYQAALEQRHWDDAKEALLVAAQLDPLRFEPFPLRKYALKQILGAGGFGTAFLCEDQHLEIPVVIKTLHQAALERNVREVFREARILQALQHPNIIQVAHCDFADQEQTRPYLVMAYFPGMTLDEYLKQHGCLKASSVRQLAIKLAEGMQAAHAQGILHRDLKPANILVSISNDDMWNVRIIDFGLALQADQVQKTILAARFTGSLLDESVGGSYQYAAPEQLGLRPGLVGPYSDVFGFGKTLCLAIFATANPTRRDWHTLETEDEPLANILSQCIDEDITHRMSNFTDVVAILKELEAEAKKIREAKIKRQQEEDAEKIREAEAKRQQEEARRVHEAKKHKKTSPYILQGNGTVIDSQTNLQWMRCSLGQTWDGKRCIGEAKKYTWEEALQAAKDLNALGGYAGCTDWRVPSVTELYSLVYCSFGKYAPLKFDEKGEPQFKTGCCEDEYQRPTINLNAFPDTPKDWFWSSSLYTGHGYGAWLVNFVDGQVYSNYKDYAVRVRLVRVRQ